MKNDTNFGRNRVLQPSAAYTPANEQEVLEILDRHRGQSIRAVGLLTSNYSLMVTSLLPQLGLAAKSSAFSKN